MASATDRQEGGRAAGRQTRTKEYYPFLDGIRGLACVMVFLGHYFIAFCVKDIVPLHSPAYRLGGLALSGPFAVSTFCIISGFLAARKRVHSLKGLASSCIKRFLRFELPIMTVIALVMLLNDLGLFACGDALAGRLENKRILGQFTYRTDYLSLLTKPFWAFWTYDNPLWMIGQLFIGGIAVYLRSYVLSLLEGRLSGKLAKAARPLSLVALALCASIDTTILAVILGAGCYELYRRYQPDGLTQPDKAERQVKTPRREGLLKGLVLAACLLVLLLDIYLYFIQEFDYLDGGRERTWAGLAGAFASFCLVLSSAPLKALLASRPLQQLGAVSFGIYVLHYPLLGLVSCRMIYGGMERMDYAPLVLLTLLATGAAVLGAAALWHLAIEAPIQRLIGRLP